MLRVALPDRPGSLGLVASALGTVQADISAVEIVDRVDGYAVDDFMLSVPATVPPDAMVAACTAIPGVEVVWLSYYPETWGLQADVDVLNRMTEYPDRAESILLEAAPEAFHAHWALVVDRTGPAVLAGTELAPSPTPAQLGAFGDLASAHSVALPSGWADGWGESEVTVAPFREGRSIVLGRNGGPGFRRSEEARLRLMATLAGH